MALSAVTQLPQAHSGPPEAKESHQLPTGIPNIPVYLHSCPRNPASGILLPGCQIPEEELQKALGPMSSVHGGHVLLRRAGLSRVNTSAHVVLLVWGKLHS